MLCFIRRTFSIVNPGVLYIHNWHIDAIAEALNEVYLGNIRRLIINIPPRYLKSFCVSVAFPSWVLANNSSKRIIVASYSEKLAIKHSIDSRLIMQSDWFRSIFVKCVLSEDQNAKYKFSTNKNGYRFATSVGGTLTGEGGDILIIDDPHSPQQVLSEKYRNKTLEWYKNTFSNRLDDKKNGAIILVMQRLHTDDLSGYLLNNKNKDWFHLNLPVFFENNSFIKVGKFEKRISKGEFLCQKREGEKEINILKSDMGSYFFNAQYQQKPMSNNCGMIKNEWLIRYYIDVIFENIYLSFDTAIKAGINNDPTVCTVWGEYKNNYYLIDVIRKWLEYSELKKESFYLIEKWNPSCVLIEDKSSGQILIQDLRKESKLNVIPIKPTKDKITRFASITPMFESGRIFLRENDIWLFDYEYEILSFPNSKHDDQVDSTSQFLNWVSNRNYVSKTARIIRI